MSKKLDLGPKRDIHDYEFKKSMPLNFWRMEQNLGIVFLRSIIFKEQGQILLLKLAQELEEYGKVEQLPVLEGKK